jgi:hypothetical protein
VRILKRNIRARFYQAVVAVSLIFLSAGSSVVAAPETGKVEIVIRNYVFEFQGGVLRPNEQGTILLKNVDKIQHGFTSPYLEEQDVRVESAGGISYGKGIKGVYINPGETLQIHFIPNRPGRLPFRCDIHPNMKGELLVLSVGGV